MNTKKRSPLWNWALVLLPSAGWLVLSPNASSEAATVKSSGDAAIVAAANDADEDADEDSDKDDPNDKSTVRHAVTSAMRQAQNAFAGAADFGRSVAAVVTSGGPPRTLVLPGDTLKPEAADELNENLAVMSRILQKAARQGDPSKVSWFSMNGVGSWGHGLDAMYLEGFGALFTVNVDFPLVRPPEPKASPSSEVTDETWERTRRELHGANDGFNWEAFELNDHFNAVGEPYKASRVEDLREDLIDALKHSTNLSSMRGEDMVSVVVFGGPSMTRFKAMPGRKNRVRAEAGDDSAPEVHAFAFARGMPAGKGMVGSVMTLRVKKSDVDAYAKGDLERADFAKRVRITVR